MGFIKLAKSTLHFHFKFTILEIKLKPVNIQRMTNLCFFFLQFVEHKIIICFIYIIKHIVISSITVLNICGIKNGIAIFKFPG
jgi:hypothetical protein